VDAFREAFAAHAAEVLRPEDLTPALRIDAVVPGDVLNLELAEELQRLAPFGMGNPEPNLLVPCAVLDDPRGMGEDKHVAFTLSAGGARSRAVCFGAGAKLPAQAGRPVEAALRLEANRWNGAVEPRLVLKNARPARPRGIEVIGEPATFPEGIWAELARALDAGRTSIGRPKTLTTGREPRDVRGAGIGGLITDLTKSGSVVGVVAHAPHREKVLRERVGGFALISWAALEDDPAQVQGYEHVVLIDPPTRALEHLPGDGWTHLAWGAPELGFARRIHEWDYALRAPLADLYRAIRAAGSMTGEACEAALRGDGPQPRSAALAGRLVRVLSELRLMDLQREGPALTVVAPPVRTSLERSPAFRAYQRRLEDGLRFLSTSQPTRRAA
jgi:single-stranded-DNA-specific exonuclease